MRNQPFPFSSPRISPGACGAPLRWAKKPLLLLLASWVTFSAQPAPARDTIGGNRSGAASGASGANAASQTATAATAATAQAAQAAVTARRAQDSFVKAATAFQALQSTQAAARAAALLSPNPAGVTDGLGVNGLNPVGGVPTPLSGPAIQLIQLGSGGKNQLALGNSGSVTLPSGTPGSDQIAVTGSGTVTSAGGTVTTTAGSLTTSTGGTLSATNGGSVALTAGSGTLQVTSATTLTSTLAGTVTLAAGGTVSLAANQQVTIPAGSTIAFTGSGAGTVNLSGVGAVTLTGAGTLALDSVSPTVPGGTITTSSGTTSFTNGGTVSSLAAGTKISVVGSGTISLNGTTDGSATATLPLILSSNSAFTTTGTELTTQSYNLPNDPTYGWTGVSALSQSTGNGLSTVTVTQNSQEAMLYWTSFNIGKNTALDFDQSAGGANVGTWVAINQIVNNPALSPTKILGSIEAPGQVYVIDQNGIVFGGSSQVNVHNLTASSLPINTPNLTSPEQLLGGATTEDQFLFSQLEIDQVSGVTNALPTFIPPAAPAGGDGDVVVQAGAQLSSPTTPEHVGGRIALIGPVVDNEGTISTPDGQAILAAGLQVGFTAHAQTDPTLRGLDVFIGEIDPGADANGVAYGTVTNGGLLEVPRADVTMAGMNVNQNGVIDSLTSVALDGRIDLLADYGASASIVQVNGVNDAFYAPSLTGTVTFGANSVTQILPDTTGATVVGSSLALPSLVNVEGQSIQMESGAELLAPGASAIAPVTSSSGTTAGTVDLAGARITSGVNFDAGAWVQSAGAFSLSYASGQVSIDPDAVIDVSGSQDVSASVTENIIPVQLRGSELADSPTQQTGALRGQTVDVDISQSGVYDGTAWIGSPIGDLSGYAALVQHTVNELTVNGGTVAIQGGAVNIGSGSTINVSGGWINYQGADVATTKVVTTAGQILDISQATPDLVYQGIYSGFTVASPKWGVSQTFNSGLESSAAYEPGYVQGGNAGAVTISTSALAFQGNLYGNTVAGAKQTAPTQQVTVNLSTSSGGFQSAIVTGLSQFANANFSSSASSPYNNFMTQILDPILATPKSGSLVLNLFTPTAAQTPQDIVFQPSVGAHVADPFAASGNSELDLSADLVSLDGFANLIISGNYPLADNYNATSPGLLSSMAGDITVAEGAALTAQPGGSISFAAVNIDIEAPISVPGGSLSFLTQNVLASQSTNVLSVISPNAGRGDFTLGANASLVAAGLVVDNEAGSPTANTLTQSITGGSITIKSLNVDLEAGSSIDASGGVLLGTTGKATYGKGGSIDIEAGQDPYTDASKDFGIVGGTLNLGATLSAFSGSTGGSLSILAPAIQVGGDSLENGDTSGAPVQESGLAWGNGTTLWLDKTGAPDFFSQGGFSSFSVSGLGLAPARQPYLSTPAIVIASGTNLNPLVENYQEIADGTGANLMATTNPLASQRTPINLTFSALGVNATGLVSPVLVARGDLVMNADSSIQTDPLGTVTLNGQSVAVLGQVYAPGGTITVAGAKDSNNLFQANNSAVDTATDIVATVDLGPDSVLSTAGVAEQTFNAFGYNTGTVVSGGTLNISGNIVAEANAVLDVSGASATFDVLPGSIGEQSQGLAARQMVPTSESSNGGTINLKGGEELFVDATLKGSAGGPDAQPGSLSISNGFSNYGTGNQGAAPIQTQDDATLVVTQSGATRASSLTGDSVIGQMVTPSHPTEDAGGDAIMGYFAAAPNLFVANAADPSTADNGGVAGGFGSLTLNGTVQFLGPVSINASARLVVATATVPPGTQVDQLTSGGVIYADSAVTLSSAYVRLGLPFNGPDVTDVPSQPLSGPGSLTVNSSTLTDIGDISLENIDQLNVVTAGDVRGDGALNVTGNISISAAQIYPATDTVFTIAAFAPANGTSSVTFAHPAGALPSLPLSAGGILDIYADTIDQGGVLRAPMGTINLGSLAPPAGLQLPATTQLTLTADSVVSVSAVDSNTGLGVTIPYGQIDNNGNWIDPFGNTITAGSNPTLPAKAINISASTVDDISGSVIDVRGGGDLSATQFISGTGGTNDILASTQSFAILPTSGAAYAPFDTDTGYATSSYSGLQVGDQVYLSASSGLPAGDYTLLPARYATLPGAFLVTPASGVPSGTTVTEIDGSSLVSGYRLSSLNSSMEQPLFSLFDVASPGVISARAAYDTLSANTYFAQNAATLNVTPPRLPNDAGQVVLQATASLALPDNSGTLLGQGGAGGLGSIVDIASPTAINIYDASNPATPVVAGDLNLDASALSSFGADSLLIGGIRTVTSTGTTVTVSTSNLTVNDAGTPLIGSDIILVSSGSLTVGAGSAVESLPSSTVEAPLLKLTGDGSAVRISSDPTAQIARTGVTANAGDASLTIGAGAMIGSVDGGGSVILDSTSLTDLDPTAQLSAESVALNTGQLSIVLPTLATPITTPLSGLVLSSATLDALQATANNFSILSYSSLDIWGSGDIGAGIDSSGHYQIQNVALHAAEIRGFDNGGNTVNVNAQNVVLDNSPGGTGLGIVAGTPSFGTLAINSATLSLGVNALAVDQFAHVVLSASNAIMLGNGKGSLTASGDLTLSTPLLTVAPVTPLTALQEANGEPAPTATTQTISAAGILAMVNPGGAAPSLPEGLGGNVTLAGSSVTANTNIQLPSGALAIVATTGDLSVGGNLDVSGTQENLYSLTEYTAGGQISLSSYTGNVTLNSGSTVNVSANAEGGNAGSLAISAPEGTFAFAGSAILGQGGTGGQGGAFTLDAGQLTGTNLSPLEQALNPVVPGTIAGDTYLGGFTDAQTIRLRNGDITIDGKTATQSFNLSTDTGSITVGTATGGGLIAASTGATDANGASTASIDVTTAANGSGDITLNNPGTNGGSISLEANGSVTLLSDSLLSVAGQVVNDAGQGGAVTLEAGAETDGVENSTSQSRDGTTMRFTGTPVVDIQTGSVIDLSVANTNPVFDGSEIIGTTGTLHLRAPQTANNTDVQIDPINGTVVNASSIVVEGYELYTATDGSIDNQEGAVLANGTTFAGAAAQPATTSYTAMLDALLSPTSANAGLQALTTIEPGAEIINPTGDLTLNSNWDLSTYRFGPNSAAGDLTLRAQGNLIFEFGASLSDGFTTNPSGSLAADGLWSDVLMPQGSSSWSYRLIAGADLGAADFRDVLPLLDPGSLIAADPSAVAANQGTLELGLNALDLPTGSSETTLQLIKNNDYYQTIRTGTGDIDIATAGDVQILNDVATIYTAGTQSAPLTGFAVPTLSHPRVAGNSSYDFPGLGTTIIAQYSQNGGNLTLSAQGNIAHYAPYSASSGQAIVAYDINGNPLMDYSSKEVPTSWLYRRGFADGDTFATDTNHQVASTSWWIDFSNFFEGVGALGGGNVTLNAGQSVINVDAVVPTNARMPGEDASGNLIAPAAGSLVESGGGDLAIHAGDNIDGGIYYVERGQGLLDAGDQILTNATRNVVLDQPDVAENNLPTTLFLGKGSFDLSAGGDLLLGSVVNPFLLPQGINNTDNEKSYFSTYASTDTVDVSSLTGSITIRDAAPTGLTGSLLLDYYDNLVSVGDPSTSLSYSAPWLGLVESDPNSFDSAFRMMPPTFAATAFSGDINLQGNLTLSPSAVGTLDLAAAGSVNGFQPVLVGATGQVSWASSQIDLSDADPNNIPGVATPLSYAANPNLQISLSDTNPALFIELNSLFAVSGSTDGLYALISTQQALHADLPINPSDPTVLGPLHANDTTPIHIYAATGDIDGVNLFSGKMVDVVAGNDISNISLYTQNVNSSDITLVEAGRDIIAYDPNSVLRVEAHATGGIYLNENDDATNPSTFLPNGGGAGAPNAGDFQIAGPGTLEVLAGRNLDLGDGPNNGDGTGLGIVSIGNTVDPSLSTFTGANIIAAAGLGDSGQPANLGVAGFGLDATHNSLLDFSAFENLFLDPNSGGTEAALYLPVLGTELGLTNVSNDAIWNAFEALPFERQDALATTVFYDVLRDAGRDHNNPDSPYVGTYAEGYLALGALFPSTNTYQGDISLTAREIKTTNGGDINLLAPGGGVDVGINNSGSQAVDQGILTVDGGNISIFANNNVAVGTSRIFTLHGGNEIIWSTHGNIAAGASSKTVQSAPPTRVLIDPTSGNVQTDLAGLATGGGIGVLETVVGAPPGNVDLIAPSGIVDAGDAGIRSSGNINIAAATILNAGNIQAGGSTSGVAPAPTPNIGATVAAASAGGSSQNAATEAARQQQPNQSQQQDLPSIISVEIIGYSADDSADTEAPSADQLLARNNTH